MLRALIKIILVLAGLAALAFLALALVVDADDYRPHLERVASEVSGYEVRVDGDIVPRLFPAPHLALSGIRVREDGRDLARVERADIRVEFLPLFKLEVRPHRLILEGVHATLERSEAPPVVLDVRECVFSAEHMRMPREVRFNLDDLILLAELDCGGLRVGLLEVPAFRATVTGTRGLYEFDPVEMDLFGGRGRGRAVVDLTGDDLEVTARYSLDAFRLVDFLQSLSPGIEAEGELDFTMEVVMSGDPSGLTSSARGVMSMRGRGMVLHGMDIDRELDNFESSQRFNLVDAGAFLIAGPVGIAVTKGRDFTRLLQGAEGRTHINAMVSDWSVDRGIAHADDVAFATDRNLLALKGELDFAHERFRGFEVAVLDPEGCPLLQQEITGTFSDPQVRQPSMLAALTGPVRELFGRFTRRSCEVFYTGSVAHPSS